MTILSWASASDPRCRRASSKVSQDQAPLNLGHRSKDPLSVLGLLSYGAFEFDSYKVVLAITLSRLNLALAHLLSEYCLSCFDWHLLSLSAP